MATNGAAQTPVRNEQQKDAEEVHTPMSVNSDISVDTPATPTTPATPGSIQDHEMDENELDISNASIATEKAFMMGGAKGAPTPGPIRARRVHEENKMLNSPSDAMLSPCTTMLMGRGGKKAISGPAAALRKKQVGSIPFKLDD